ncbi:MAG: hypothetical protein JRL30_18220 [Deltaproteobacteria bacterium]|nr:hypothetical protein [Deltaproteobacteria bacterium]
MLRRLFYTLWYLFHLKHLGRVLFLFVFGLVFLLGAAYYGTAEPLSTQPEDITPEGAAELLRQSDSIYIRMKAELDFTKKIFRTGGWSPYWGNCPPDTIYGLPRADAAKTEFRKLLGCRVQTTGRLSEDVTRLVQKTADNRSTSEPMHVDFTPLTLTGRRIWVRSAFFKKGDAREQEWLRTRNFSGILSTMDKALRTLPKGYINLQYAPRTIRPDTYVIIPCAEYKDRARDYFSTHFWVPVKGSGPCLFVWASTDFEVSFAGIITGVLKPLGKNDHETLENEYLQFEEVTGNKMPERFGVIRRQTAEAVNRHTSGAAGVFLVFGLMWAGGGLLGIVLYIGGPRIIYSAWQKAAEEFEPWHSGTQSAAASGAPQKKRQRPVRGSSLTKNQGRRSQTTAAKRHISLFEDLNSATKVSPIYLAMVQDFMSLTNYGGFFRAMGTYKDAEEALKALYGQGQRSPGLVVEVVASNGRMLSAIDEEHPFPDTFKAFRFDSIVLTHAPGKFVTERFGIWEVFCSSVPDALMVAERSMKQLNIFSVAGRIFEIADAEHGPYTGMEKIPGRGSIKGIR